MTEEQFWVYLEFRLGPEFQGLPELRFRCWWCDGFVPEEYSFDGPRPRITGFAWICDGPKQAQWRFTLLLPRATRTRESIDWRSLLPKIDTTCWMSFDEAEQTIEIEPEVARPDLL